MGSLTESWDGVRENLIGVGDVEKVVEKIL